MKRVIKLFATLALLTGVFGVVATHKEAVAAEAATVTTKRVWATAKDISWWFNADAQFGIETRVGETYVKSVMVLEPNNQVVEGANTWPIYYLDIPTNITHIQWFRKVGTNEYNFTGFNAYGTGLFYLKSPNPAYLDTARVFNTTKAVADFAATIDTQAEACSTSNAQAAVNAYNNLSTFEQDQFDILQVGGGKTGLERLNFLKSFYNISTPLNTNVAFGTDNKNILGVAIIGGLAISSILGYYFLKTKKFI